MIPNKELQELARAILNTPEYTGMMKSRKKIQDNAALGRRLLAFEKEQNRIINGGGAPEAVSAQLKKLHEEQKDFLNEGDVKGYVSAAKAYESMIDSCLAALGSALRGT